MEDLKHELINNIIVKAENQFDFEINKLSNLLILCFEPYRVEKRETQIAIAGDIVDNNAIIKKFAFCKLADGRSKKTVKYYMQVMNMFFDRIKKAYNEVSSDDIRFYLAERQIKDGISETTANNERRNISAFYTWCAQEELIVRNPVAKTVPIKEKREKKKAFTETEIEKIRVACKNNREKAIVEMLLSTACRVTELASIKKDDINGNKIRVVGKGNKVRYVFLNAKAEIALYEYLKERSDENVYIFPAMLSAFDKNVKRKCKQGDYYKNKKNIREDGHLDIGSIRLIVHKIGIRAGNIHAHPHKFRRTAATMALKHGMPVEQVSKMLGHEQLTTTQIYLDLTDEMLAEAHRKYVM